MTEVLEKKDSAIVERPVSRRYIALLLNIGLMTIAALFWGSLTYDNAPFVYHPDEPDLIARAVRMVVTGDLNPHWFHYPTLLFYLEAAILKMINFFVDLPLDFGLSMGVRGVDQSAFILYQFGRLVVVFFSLGTLFLLLRLASRFTSALMASLAGFMFVGSQTVTASAASVTVDMPMTFFMLAAVTMMVKFLDSAEDGQLKERYYWYAMILGGLAAGTKYNGAAILFMAPLLVWLIEAALIQRLRLLILGALLSVAIFLATTPYALLDTKTFLNPGIGMLYDFRHYASGHPGADKGITAVKVMKDLLTQNSVLVFFILCLPFTIRRRLFRKSILPVIFSLFLFISMVAIAKVYFTRNILMALPLVDCLSVCGVWAVVHFFRSSKKKRLANVFSLGVLAVACGVAIITSYMNIRARLHEQTLPDTRTAAYEWILDNIPAKSAIIYEAYCPQIYYSRRYSTTYTWTIAQVPFEKILRDYDYVIVSDTQWERYSTLRLRTHEQVLKLPLLQEWQEIKGVSRGPTVRIYTTHIPDRLPG